MASSPASRAAAVTKVVTGAEFMINATVGTARIAAGDVVRNGYGTAADAPIAPADIATVAARWLTGPESLTRRDRVPAVGAALGWAVS